MAVTAPIRRRGLDEPYAWSGRACLSNDVTQVVDVVHAVASGASLAWGMRIHRIG